MAGLPCSAPDKKYLLCSMTVAMPQITGLAELPFDLKVKVIDKLLRDSSQQFNFAVTVQLRLICKSWQGAVAAYPAAIQCTQPKHLLGICKTFPMMTCLILQYVEDPDIPSPSLSPLAECFHLKYLKIDQHQHWGDGLDLSFLPKSLCSLELVRVTVDTSKLDFITLPQVSQLSITDLSLSLSNTERLLEKMPSVKVSNQDCKMINSSRMIDTQGCIYWMRHTDAVLLMNFLPPPAHWYPLCRR